MDVKKVFSFSGFPDHLATNEEKKDYAFGLQMAKAIEREWFYRNNGSGCTYYDNRREYSRLRAYARGEQDTKIYKDLLVQGDESSYTNYDWRPIQVVPKFLNLIVNQMSERLFNIRAEAVDKFSTDLRDSHRKNLDRFVKSIPIRKAAMEYLNLDTFPDNMEDMPSTEEEIDLFMKLKFKLAIEIACEEAIKYTLDLNDYKEVQTCFIEDVATLGIGALKHYTDPNKGIVVDWVDPARLVYSYPEHKNFKDVHYFGEVKRITINELKRISGKSFTDEELKELVEGVSKWQSYHNLDRPISYRDGDLDNNMVDVLFFTFQSTNDLVYKKKYTNNGGFKLVEKDGNFDKVDNNPNYDLVKNSYEVWYEGVLVLGTEHLFNYKLCENMIRPEGYLNRTLPNYVVYAPELYLNKTKSLIGRIIPYVDSMQQIHIKIQQMVAKARPNGIYIDVSGLNEIDFGEGNELTPMELIKIYDETGNVLGSSSTDDGSFNHGRVPIQELKNGVIDGLDRLIGAYNQYLNQLRDAIGIPQGADASLPHPDTLVGVQQQAAANSNLATRHILDSALNSTERLVKGLVLRLKDIFKYSDLKNAYINAIGKINVKTLESLKKYHLHDLGINIELKPDAEEKALLEANIRAAQESKDISLVDAIDIRSVQNIKLANELLKVRKLRNEKLKREHEKALIRETSEGQAMVAERASKAKQEEYLVKSESEIRAIQAKGSTKVMELEKEAELKKDLMAQEFSYNMQLKGVEYQGQKEKDKYREDRKDKRQDKAKSQESELIEQRQKSTAPKNFSASESNLTGDISLSRFNP